jgi:hypothetical protein
MLDFIFLITVIALVIAFPLPMIGLILLAHLCR